MATDGIVDLEAWGGKGGNPWSHKVIGQILNIIITYDANGINSIKFISKDGTGQTSDESGVFGVEKGTKKEILIDTKVEKIIGINGAYGPYANTTLVKSLTFITDSKRSIGPFGAQKPEDTPFSFSVGSGNRLVGFHGRSGWYIDSIGVHKQTVGSAKVGPYSPSNVGSPWSYEPQGFISRMFGDYRGTFHIVQFESIDENGVKHTSDRFGTYEYTKYSVDADKGNRIIGISGTCRKPDIESILCYVHIYTNKKAHGPFGDANGGTNFSFKVKNGYVSGFHGRSERAINAIGIYVKPA